MISFQFDQSSAISWLTLGLSIVVLVGQFWLIARNESLTAQRKSVRLGLNGLLWLVLIGYILQPIWTVSANSTHALLVSDDVPGSFRQKISDSLHLREVATPRSFNVDRFDSVTLVGQDFPPELLSRLSRQAIRWIPYVAPDQVQAIHWKGIVQKGEMQRVSGVIQSSQKQRIKLMYAGKTLDSLDLAPGTAPFSLQFPAFTLGRTETELVLDGKVLDTIRFFARPMRPLTYRFMLGTPDFESRTLADWLGKNGNSVQVTASLSKDVSNRLTINRAAGKPDVIVTDPSNAANGVVKRAVADGKAVLFINLTNPEADCRLINQSLGSRFLVRKMSNEPLVPVGSGLQALPYTFGSNPAQMLIPGYPVAVQQTAGKVGVSLINETFPLKLSGDSLAYSRVWSAVLARLQPASTNTAEVDAPVFAGFRETVHINNVPAHPSRVRVAGDTVPLMYSPINPLSANGQAYVKLAGWHPVEDTLAMYAEGTGFANLTKNRRVQAYVRAHAADAAERMTVSRTTDERLPDWAWLLLFVGCFTCLWLEPKLGS